MTTRNSDTIVGIAAKAGNSRCQELSVELIQWLNRRGLEYRVDRTIADEIGLESVIPEKFIPREDLTSVCNPIVVFGGDGTLVSVCRYANSHYPVIIGVNVGTLGFLTEATVEEFYSVLESVLAGTAQIIKKQLLEGELCRQDKTVIKFHAMNDVVLGKGALGRIYGIDLFINEEAAARFRGDGLIVATPAGSTAYSLAAGGAIVHPRLNALLVTPICSHFLTSRPLVLPGDARLRMKIAVDPVKPEDSAKKMFLTIDGQQGQEILVGDELIVSLSPHCVSFAKSPSKNYFDVLTTKLKWGTV